MGYRQSLRELAFDSHGVVTLKAAAGAGVPAVEVRKLAARGALVRLGTGVYRMLEVPRGRLDQFAEAVALVGSGAVLIDESVLAAHDLAQVNLRRIKVATTSRLRKVLPPHVQVVRRRVDNADREDIDGIPAMSLTSALLASRNTVLADGLLVAAKQAAARGMITSSDERRVREALQT